MSIFWLQFRIKKRLSKKLNLRQAEIDYEKIKNLNGKKVKITGKTTVVKGVENSSKEEDKIITQGCSKDVIYIKFPKNEIISD